MLFTVCCISGWTSIIQSELLRQHQGRQRLSLPTSNIFCEERADLCTLMHTCSLMHPCVSAPSEYLASPSALILGWGSILTRFLPPAHPPCRLHVCAQSSSFAWPSSFCHP